jgi:hypothetical protein
MPDEKKNKNPKKKIQYHIINFNRERKKINLIMKLTCSISRSGFPKVSGSAIPSERKCKETSEEDKAQAS